MQRKQQPQKAPAKKLPANRPELSPSRKRKINFLQASPENQFATVHDSDEEQPNELPKMLQTYQMDVSPLSSAPNFCPPTIF